MNRQAALGLPPFDGPFAAIQKRGYLFPGVQPPVGLRTAVNRLRMSIWSHRPEMARHGPSWHFARRASHLIINDEGSGSGLTKYRYYRYWNAFQSREGILI